ncbi:MAG: hypothetical protein EBS49_00960, partial [Verrucomicrobia bacterium]|nr:hypothetical protein [Verrucomicrobiota bacterium]
MTVALDSNSLSSLENITVTVGAAVTVSNFPVTQQVSGTVTISNLPATQAISGTVTANGGDFAANFSDTPANRGVQIGYENYDRDAFRFVTLDDPLPVILRGSQLSDGQTAVTQPISGTVTANTSFGSSLGLAIEQVDDSGNVGQKIAVQLYNPTGLAIGTSGQTLAVSGTVTIGSLPAISGTVTANLGGIAGGVTMPVRLFAEQSGGPTTGQDTLLVCDSSGRLNVGLYSSAGGTDAISYDGSDSFVKTKNLANPSGALTTRFGSVTTANTAQISAVTNASRKFLLVQNIATSTVTIGIGFSPTTTQGIQLAAGAGLTFDSFVPTGAVYWLGATTG